MTQLVQILLTPEQAALLGAAADVTVRAHEAETLVVLKDDEKASYEQLAVFMGQVALKPEAFPVTGRMASSIKKHARKIKNTTQAQHGTNRSVTNKRKERQERRMRTHKSRRSQRRAMAEEYNKARAITEAEIAEMQAIQDERMAQIEAEPKFTVTDIMGNVLIDNVPESMIVPVAREVYEGPEEFFAALDAATLPSSEELAQKDMLQERPRIIMPGTAEALGVDLASDDTPLD